MTHMYIYIYIHSNQPTGCLTKPSDRFWTNRRIVYPRQHAPNFNMEPTQTHMFVGFHSHAGIPTNGWASKCF